jgi:hypothetical protein
MFPLRITAPFEEVIVVSAPIIISLPVCIGAVDPPASIVMAPFAVMGDTGANVMLFVVMISMVPLLLAPPATVKKAPVLGAALKLMLPCTLNSTEETVFVNRPKLINWEVLPVIAICSAVIA